jgi:uncharacterized protein (TIGR02996 family)
MPHDEGFLEAVRADPDNDWPRLVYADWLDERDDPRGDFLRLYLGLKALPPDHLDRVPGEHELSFLRRGCDAAWLAIIEPERVAIRDPSSRRGCVCFVVAYEEDRNWPAMYLHSESQDTECDAWKRLLDLVEDAAADGREMFAPGRELGPRDWAQITTLPATLAKLKAVKHLDIYGSYLVRIPPEVGEMTSLEEFTPYTSYRLHWFPYELTRCRCLRESTVSTRALYGNYKLRPPFPRLDPGAPAAPGRLEPGRLPLKRFKADTTRGCSVCGRRFEDMRLHRVWVSLRVATDVLPLLVNACSAECVARLPKPPAGYVPKPHRGGPEVEQPPPH